MRRTRSATPLSAHARAPSRCHRHGRKRQCQRPAGADGARLPARTWARPCGQSQVTQMQAEGRRHLQSPRSARAAWPGGRIHIKKKRMGRVSPVGPMRLGPRRATDILGVRAVSVTVTEGRWIDQNVLGLLPPAARTRKPASASPLRSLPASSGAGSHSAADRTPAVQLSQEPPSAGPRRHTPTPLRDPGGPAIRVC